jgi:CDP-diacylglycerol--glycerol-3-phosphate 3-phosphatidyltransferase
MRWLPNMISVLRAVASLGVVALLTPDTAALALIVFGLAAATDGIDGWLARRLRATSDLGAFLDPLADKILVLGTLAGLLATGGADAAPVAVILAREVAVTALRAAALGRGLVVGSTIYGKAKAGLQGLAVSAEIAVFAWPALDLGMAAAAILWVAALVTVATGVDVARRSASAIGRTPSRAVRADAR